MRLAAKEWMVNLANKVRSVPWVQLVLPVETVNRVILDRKESLERSRIMALMGREENLENMAKKGWKVFTDQQASQVIAESEEFQENKDDVESKECREREDQKEKLDIWTLT